MARIIENDLSKRRTIKLSVDDVLTVVREYQRIIPRNSDYLDIRNFLSDTVIFLPEEI